MPREPALSLPDRALATAMQHMPIRNGARRARVSSGLTVIDVLRATFPAGTVSGAAQVRAWDSHEEREPVKRGIYAGAVGYLGFHGNMDVAIALRTAAAKDGKL